jgi:hypothetical protein
MRRAPRRISVAFTLTCLLCGILITFLTAGPASFLHAWLGTPGGSYFSRRVDTPPLEFGPWEIGRTTETFTDTWVLMYPGQYSMRADNPQPLVTEPPTWVHQADETDYHRRETPYTITTFGFGWPFPAFRTIAWHAQRDPPGVTPSRMTRQYVSQREHAWLVLTVQRGLYPVQLTIPTSPIWPGLIADVALWSALFAAVWLGLAQLRTTIRRRRSLCTACAYNRKGLDASTPCPECGYRDGKSPV